MAVMYTIRYLGYLFNICDRCLPLRNTKLIIYFKQGLFLKIHVSVVGIYNLISLFDLQLGILL